MKIYSWIISFDISFLLLKYFNCYLKKKIVIKRLMVYFNQLMEQFQEIEFLLLIM
jgi:hypothetical protein